MKRLKKNAINLLIFVIVILSLFGLSYQLNKNTSPSTKADELTVTIEGGGTIVRNNIKKFIIYKNEEGKVEYFRVIYPASAKYNEIYNVDRIINFNYLSEIKDKIKIKPTSKLRIK